MNIAKCPNLVEWLDWVILLCEKGNKPYIPDLSELQKYCKNNNYNSCPYYIKPEDMALKNKDLNTTTKSEI
jgi:hypothetical protein